MVSRFFAAKTPIAFVPPLGSTLLVSRDDISISEKQVDVFSSHQPAGLMNRLMGHNMIRKDGEAHQVERRAMFPLVSPKTVRARWTALFQRVGWVQRQRNPSIHPPETKMMGFARAQPIIRVLPPVGGSARRTRH